MGTPLRIKNKNGEYDKKQSIDEYEKINTRKRKVNNQDQKWTAS
jgi:hypothetical protein